MRKDNGRFVGKQRLRAAAIRATPGARVLEGFAGEGRMYRACWAGQWGVTIDRDEAKARDAAYQRPRWAVYAGDTERALRAGWFAEVPFEIVDLDAYGSPWPFVLAWFASERERAPVTTMILTDGYMRHASLSPPCRTLFGGRAREPVKDRARHSETHKLVEAAVASGRINILEPCEACGTKQRREGAGGLWAVVRHHFDYARPLDTIPLCRPCHQRVHEGQILEPRTGRRYAMAARRMDVSRGFYMETVRLRLGEWAAGAGCAIEAIETTIDRYMCLYVVRISKRAPPAPGLVAAHTEGIS